MGEIIFKKLRNIDKTVSSDQLNQNLWGVGSKEHWFYLFIFRFYLSIFREKGREGQRGRETLMCERYIDWFPLTRALLGTWPITWHVSWLGIEPAALQFTGRSSIHWATPVRGKNTGFKNYVPYSQDWEPLTYTNPLYHEAAEDWKREIICQDDQSRQK